MDRIVIDFETFYDDEYSLKKMTPAEYVNHPKFICNGASVKVNGHPARWLRPEHLPQAFAALPTDAMMISHNMLFDGLIAAWKYNYRPRLFVDTMGLARAALPRLRHYSLGKLAEYLELPRKDETLLPKVKGMDLPTIEAAGYYRAYTQYAIADSEICRGIFDCLIPGFPAAELVIMDMVLRCAILPRLALDRALLYEHQGIVDAEKAQLLAAAGLAGRAELMSQDRFAQLLEMFGIKPPRKISLRTGKETWAFAKTDADFMALLEDEDPRVQALVAARLGLRSTLEQTRTARLIAIGNVVKLMPVPLRFSGAHTHRLSGEWGINLQNLPRGGRLRRALIAPEGCVIIAGDLSQIEARLVAWLAGCLTLLTAFAEGRDVYAEFASGVFGFTVTAESNPAERFVGKTAILGLGYGLGDVKFADRIGTGSVAALGYKLELEGAQPRNIVYGYRNRYHEVPTLWEVLDQHAIAALLGETEPFTLGPLTFEQVFLKGEAFGHIRLPSGLALWYARMERDEVTGEATFFNPHYQSQEKLYGGKLLENVTQALARVVIMDAAVRIQRRLARFVMQVHDELVYVVPEALADITKAIVHEEMVRPPAWAPDVPLAAKIGVGKSYGDAK